MKETYYENCFKRRDKKGKSARGELNTEPMSL